MARIGVKRIRFIKNMEANNMNPESIDRMNKAFSKFGEAMAEAAKVRIIF